MNIFTYVLFNILETLTRAFPAPCKTGLYTIGNPDSLSPVLLTGNYHLTVLRVKKALRKIDCHLLVANSKGINVWCAATGGHLTNHDIISVIKTSGIENLVEHREIILPQLAATGIEANAIKKKSGWSVLWGPVYAKDIASFLRNNKKKDTEMRNVNFSLIQRWEMAVMWAFPFSIIVSPVLLLFANDLLIAFNLMIWSLSIFIFTLFPLYSGWLPSGKKGTQTGCLQSLIEFTRVPFLIWIVSLLCIYSYALFQDTPPLAFLTEWGLISLAIISMLSYDLMGSTPDYKSGTHEDRNLSITIDPELCKGAGFCEDVCPRNCFEVDYTARIATIPRSQQCVQCGACIVQCPFDALYFKSHTGKIVTPEIVRKYKLNLLGKRMQ